MDNAAYVTEKGDHKKAEAGSDLASPTYAVFWLLPKT